MTSRIHVITGPYGSGKSTFKNILCEELKTKPTIELPQGIDLSEPFAWNKVSMYSKKNKTSVVETHFNFGEFTSINETMKEKSIELPPKNFIIYFLLPSENKLALQMASKSLFKNIDINSREDFDLLLENAKSELAWYRFFLNQLPKSQTVVVS